MLALDLILTDAGEPVDDFVRKGGGFVVIHAAAWTDVNACAQQPALALRRNGGDAPAAQKELGLVIALCASSAAAGSAVRLP